MPDPAIPVLKTPVSSWRGLLVRLGPLKATLAVTAFSVAASVSIVLAAVSVLGMPAAYLRTALMLGALVPAVVAPAAVFVVIKLLFELEATRAELAQVAIRDALTGLYNRRYFMERLANEVARARRLQLPVSLLMIDIDWFKAVNDKHGHPAGDRVLRQVAQASSLTLRPYDVLARFGGEEFIALLPGISVDQASEVAERVRKAVAELRVPMAEGPPLSVTLSIGVGSLRRDAHHGSALIDLADQALYKAKRNGRNRCEAHFETGTAPETRDERQPEPV